MGKALLTFEELRTIITEIEKAFNSRPLSYIDQDPDSNIITPNHLIYGGNINEKCFETNHIAKISSTDTQDLAARMKLVLEGNFKRFDKEYTSALQEQHFHVNTRYGNYKRELRDDVVLIKEDLLPRMRWRKGKVINVTKGRDNLIREVELKVDQSNLNITITTNIHLQHIVPIEITEEKQALKLITKFGLSVLIQKIQISRRLKRNIVQ